MANKLFEAGSIEDIAGAESLGILGIVKRAGALAAVAVIGNHYYQSSRQWLTNNRIVPTPLETNDGEQETYED
jgi:hypothetical protein